MNNSIIVVLIVGFFMFVIPAIIVFAIISSLKNRDRRDHMRLLGEQLGVSVTGGEPFFPSIEWLSFLKKQPRSPATTGVGR